MCSDANFRRGDGCADIESTGAAAPIDDVASANMMMAPPTPAGIQPAALIMAGPTAAGKSAMALALAEEVGGTVINADSLQCYRDLRILTARPNAAALSRAPHRLYGFLDAAERGSVGRWQRLAIAEIGAVAAAGRLPILVGGSGLYLEALTGGLAPIPEIPDQVRQEAQELHRTLGGGAFRLRLAQLDPKTAERLSPSDAQRLLRAYQVVRATGRTIAAWRAAPHAPAPCRFATIVLTPARTAIYAACDERFAEMIKAGAVDEAATLAARRLDPGLPAMKAAGLRELMAYLSGAQPLNAAIAAGRRATRRYAKRQMTWFRHRSRPDLIISEQFSERLLPDLRQFINRTLLTGSA